MTRELITSGSPFEAEIGYSRAVVADGWVFVLGTTGFDYQTMTIPDDVAEQCEQALRHISRAAAGGCGLATFQGALHPARRCRLPGLLASAAPLAGTARPAATMLVAGLLDPRMRIEIEATARSANAEGGRRLGCPLDG